MVVPVLAAVLVLVAVAMVVVGVLAATHRLPRNRLIGVRTGWTMARIDSFRRANRVAAPAFLAAGVVGLAGGITATLAPTTATGVTLLVVGVVGLVALLGVAGTVGARYAEADRAETLAAENRPVGPCTLDAGDADADDAEPCATSAGACGGTCSVCPRAGAHAGEQQG